MGKVETDKQGAVGDPYAEGETVEPTVDAYGRQVVVIAEGGTGGGATEITLTTIDSKILPPTDGPPLPTDFGSPTRIVPSGQQPAAMSQSVVLASDQDRIDTRAFLSTSGMGATPAGDITSKQVDANTQGMHVVVAESALPDGAADAARQDTGNASLAAIDAGIPAALGGAGGMQIEGVVGGQAVAVSDGGSSLTVDGVVQATGGGGAALALDSSVDGLEATATSTLAAVDQVETKLGTLAAQEATTAKDVSVDDLEALATTGNATTSVINTKLLAALGTAFAVPVRATATNVAAQLPNASYGRGFVVENIDAANDLYVGPSNAVTTSNGFRISPSRSRRFDLPNSNLLWVISASTTAYQIGATT